MKRWLIFLLALTIYAFIHEGMHAFQASLYGEYRAFLIRPIGLEVRFRTPVAERSGIQWAFISGASNLVTILIGYSLLLFGSKLANLRSPFLKATSFYLTLILLLADPLNLAIGPFIYGGDANGIALGLGLQRYIIQFIFLIILLVNRELIAQRLLHLYEVQVTQFWFRPLIPLSKRTHE